MTQLVLCHPLSCLWKGDPNRFRDRLLDPAFSIGSSRMNVSLMSLPAPATMAPLTDLSRAGSHVPDHWRRVCFEDRQSWLGIAAKADQASGGISRPIGSRPARELMTFGTAMGYGWHGALSIRFAFLLSWGSGSPAGLRYHLSRILCITLDLSKRCACLGLTKSLATARR